MPKSLGETASSPGGRARRTTIYAFLFSLLVLIWVLCYFLLANSQMPDKSTPSDQAAILFGASSLALFLFSFLVAILGIIGWRDLQESTHKAAAAAAVAKLDSLEREMRGRVQSGLGFMIGELSSRADVLEATDKSRISMAVELCRGGYRTLQGLGEGPELMSLNNLVYYMAVQGDAKDSAFLLEKARLLRAKGQELNVARLLLTYCRVILKYSADPAERAEAKTIADDLYSKPLPTHERKEAEYYLASFSGA